jgi:hypothetical protein
MTFNFNDAMENLSNLSPHSSPKLDGKQVDISFYVQLI